jgi:pimeloyl-ACP methyl ester carboxylesterase
MAARFWRWVLGYALVFALAATAALAMIWPLSLAAALPVALAVLLAELLLAVLLSMLRARAAEQVATRPGLLAALRTWVSESLYLGRAILAVSANPRPQTPPASSMRPVLLIHGFLCNRGVWSALRERLYATGLGDVVAVNLEPLCTDIEQQAAGVQPELLALHRRSQGARVAIVGHSMGGLVARVLLRNLGPGVISRIVTLASPHHGTRLVAGLRWPATQQLAQDSAWLRALNVSQEGRFSVPLVSIYSLEDNLVTPAASARLEGAELHELRGLGHMGMLRSARALDCVVAALGGAGAQ